MDALQLILESYDITSFYFQQYLSDFRPFLKNLECKMLLSLARTTARC